MKMPTRSDALRHLIDVQEIQQALCRFAIALDTRCAELIDDCFTSDARISIANAGTYTRAELKDLVRVVLGELDASQHFLGPPAIHVEGDVASTRCYYVAQHARNALSPSPFLLVGGWCDDRWVRVGESWRISHHVGTAAWYEGNQAVMNLSGPALPPGGLEWRSTGACPVWLRERSAHR